MVNPQGRKGPQTMLHLIEDSDPDWTFLILEGGWGDAFKTFLPKLHVTAAFQEKRVDTEVFIDDMRKAYQSTCLVLFPSHVEGYGMTAIEPMYSGTPVLSSNYPAILEAVGEGAYTLCPFRDGRSEWKKATQEILNNHEFWCNKGFERVKELEDRQPKEIISLEKFLNQMCN
jgi:glycosyltransferase involved in cell wall biosynthesis